MSAYTDVTAIGVHEPDTVVARLFQTWTCCLPRWWMRSSAW